jgi:hypothetical protein
MQRGGSIDADHWPLSRLALLPRMARREHQPGTTAPTTGRYEELNVFGTRTGRVEHVREGDQLPCAPRGFSWRQIEQESERKG